MLDGAVHKLPFTILKEKLQTAHDNNETAHRN